VTYVAPVAYTGGVNATTSLADRTAFGRETESFAAAAEQCLDDVYAYLIYLTGDPTVAEDLTQETFEKAQRRWMRFDARRGEARTWLCQIARSTALDHFRGERRRRSREERVALPERQEARFGLGLSPGLQRALASLSAGEREVVALRVVLDLDGESAARMLGITPTACSTRLSRALRKLEEMVTSE
jgi:RNA polymerase sigma-70 factor, ECF subfamily